MNLPEMGPMVCLILFAIGITLCIFIVFVVAMSKNKCSKNVIKSQLIGINSTQTSLLNTLICNFFIKSSYNSCATGNFSNGWVNTCALEYVIKYGCRVLDFEIYSVGGAAVVATSNSVKNNEKGTYNSLPVFQVFETIKNKAISMSMSTANCPNPSDPLFLHFRIKTEQQSIYDELANHIVEYFGSNLLSPVYNIVNASGNFCNTMKLGDLMGKVIIIVDKLDTTLESSKLGDLTNLIGNGNYFHSWRYNDVAFSTNDDISDFNASGNITFCAPNLSMYPKNYSTVDTMKKGVQMSALCFQKNDVFLQTYNALFEQQKSAFIPKTTSAYTPNNVPEIDSNPQLNTENVNATGDQDLEFNDDS